jgi:hypothetical protein
MRFLCPPTTQLVDQPCTTLSFTVGFEIHHQRPQPACFSYIGWLEFLPTSYKAKETSLVSCEHNKKTKRFWPTFVSFLGAHTFQGDGPSLVYRHASTTWDEPSPEERERAMGFQTNTTSHTKVTKLEHNALLGRSMDMNSLTWLLVTCALFQMYTTLALIQSTCNSSNVITWHPDQIHLPIFSTLHFTFNVGGRRYHVIWLKLFLIHLEVHQLLQKQLQPSTNLCSWIVENPIHQVLQIHFPTPSHVFLTTVSLWGTISLRRREIRS